MSNRAKGNDGQTTVALVSDLAVTPLHLLLEAAFLPALSKEEVEHFPELTAKEARDALLQGACLWTHLVYVWAADNGQVDLRGIVASSDSPSPTTIDQERFWEALGEIQRLVDLEFSVPRAAGRTGDFLDAVGRLALTGREELHLVDRSIWFPIDFTGIGEETEIDEPDDTADLPVFAEPLLKPGSGEAVGEVWVRIAPDSQKLLQNEMAQTLESLALLGHHRTAMLREVLEVQAGKLGGGDLKILNAYLRSRAKFNEAMLGFLQRVREDFDTEKANEILVEFVTEINRLDSVEAATAGIPINVFISYSHEDENVKNELRAHLYQMQRDGLIDIWHDRRIEAGANWQSAISTALTTSEIVLIVVSSDFLASYYCYDVELKQALERHERQQAVIIPIIARDCDWKSSPLGGLQATPRDGRPIVEYEHRDKAYMQAVEAVRAATKVRRPRAAS